MLNLNFNIIGSKSFEQERGTGFNPFPVELLLIGGGGGGGNAGGGAGSGGGAGGFISASWTIPALTTFDVVIGEGGAPGLEASNGENSLLILTSTSASLFIAPGGGGGSGIGSGPKEGGSGGGSSNEAQFGSPTIPATIPSDAILAERTGSFGGGKFNFAQSAAGGGGVLNSGSNAGAITVRAAGGPGIPRTSTFISNLVTIPTFAAGGDGAGSAASPGALYATGSGGGGYGGAFNSGVAPFPNDVPPVSGSRGIFAIRYQGLPKAEGGTITQADGFTTHLFTSSSQLVVSGRNNSTP
jgi:hypothetical protein